VVIIFGTGDYLPSGKIQPASLSMASRSSSLFAPAILRPLLDSVTYVPLLRGGAASLSPIRNVPFLYTVTPVRAAKLRT
jgi:hypothetical protein